MSPLSRARFLRHTLRYAWRSIREGRGLAVVAVLALGVGVNLAVFSVVQAVLLQPLPHPDAGRLVAVWSREIGTGREHQTSPLDFFDLERGQTSFDRLAAYYPPGFTLTGGAQAERVAGARASSGIFDVFGVRPMLGRGFRAEEDRPGAPPVAVISHGLWTRRLEQDPAVVGRAIVLSGTAYTVVGVLPEGFHSPAMWPRMPDVWVPIGLDANVARRDARMLRVLGRLRQDASVATGRADLERLAAALASQHPESNGDTGVAVVPLLEQLTRDVRPSLLMLAAGVAALLLVACGNAAGLIAGGILHRRHEFATRVALGAGRARIVKQILAENVVLGLIAALTGFALAYIGSDLLVQTAAAAGVPRAAEVRVGWTTLSVGVVLSVACTTACALVSAFEITRLAAHVGMTGESRTATRTRQRTRAVLLAVEAAFSLALLAGAALLMRSFYELQLVDPGFDARNTLSTRVSPPAARYPAGPVLAGFYDRVVERVQALPGVDAAAVVDWLPAAGAGSVIGFTRAGGDGDSRARHLAELRIVSRDYFRVLAIPVVAGRAFDERDREGAPPVAIVNETFARSHFGSTDVVGRRFVPDRDGTVPLEIVGVTRDVREVALRAAPGPGIYVPKTQMPWMRAETRELVIRSSAETAPIAQAVRGVLGDLEPDVPIAPVQRLEELTAGSLVRPRFYAGAVSAFALTAVLLAAFGIAGAVGAAVAQRRREIGIRLALGATRARVLRSVTRYGVVPTLGGLVAGMPLALGAGEVVRNQLFGVEPTDVLSLIAATMAMAAVAVAAALLPAIKASRIDPAVTLRHESTM